ncbi:hypothetical protein VNI00_004696 [Paramarasmius palmivorus]|uniref:Glycoside hydrolase family 76 protein n=1 Tax=Paramarasmius palmivorus TaxID=297713 RepID=A0AAW0DIS7_9AGAR
MAEFDGLTNQKKYQAQLKQFFSTAESGFRGGLGFSYGYSALLAYNTYQDTVFLEYAEESWRLGRAYTLSSNDISTGKNANKDFTISESCRSQTMVGGSFWSMDNEQGDIVGLASGTFLVLSALLSKATSDPIYAAAANESAQFIRAHLVNSDNVVLDSISADTNKSCSSGSGIYPYNSGLLLQGLAILKNDDDMDQSYQDIFFGAVTSQTWQGNDGVISYSDSPGGKPNGDAAMIQALLEICHRNDTPTDQRSFARDYLGVQKYNAVLDQATVSGSGIYGSSWTGPPGTTFDANAQYNALSILIGAISLTDEPKSTPTIQVTGTPTISSAQESSSNNDAVIGGTVGGGVVLVLATVAGVVFVRRRKKKAPRYRQPGNHIDALAREMSESYIPSRGRASSFVAPIRPSDAPVDTESNQSTGGIQSSDVPSGKSPSLVHLEPPTPAEHLSLPQRAHSDLSTAQLVHLLNQRLNPADDTPPEYHQN